jgi:hypothetical protein
LEDAIHFGEKREHLKRVYHSAEFPNKLRLLGQYYRFHFEAPRLFMGAVARIMQSNVDEKRAVELAVVTKEMRGHESEKNTVVHTCRTIDFNQRLIKDVEFSYDDFEDRRAKKAVVGLRRREKDAAQLEAMTERNKENRQSSAESHTKRVSSVHLRESLLLFKPQNPISAKNDECHRAPTEKPKKPKCEKRMEKPIKAKK